MKAFKALRAVRRWFRVFKDGHITEAECVEIVREMRDALKAPVTVGDE